MAHGSEAYARSGEKAAMSRKGSTLQPSQAYLKSVLDYDPETGKFVWIKHSNPLTIGTFAGTFNNYRKISLLGKLYPAHRLAWMYVHGVMPAVIDHVNGNTDDNRISNLRPATSSQNSANSRKSSSNRSGAKGVSIRPDGRFEAKVRCQGVIHSLGVYGSLEEAREAYIAGAKGHFEEFAHDGERPRFITRKVKAGPNQARKLKLRRPDMVEPLRPNQSTFEHHRLSARFAADRRNAAFLKRSIDNVAKKNQEKNDRLVEDVMKYKHLWTKTGKSINDDS